jgi:hypothetical protein
VTGFGTAGAPSGGVVTGPGTAGGAAAGGDSTSGLAGGTGAGEALGIVAHPAASTTAAAATAVRTRVDVLRDDTMIEYRPLALCP